MAQENIQINIDNLANPENGEIAIAKATLTTYKTRLATIMKESGESIDWVMKNPRETIDRMKKYKKLKSDADANNGTLAACAVAVCKLYAVHPNAKKAWSSSFDEWQDILKEYRGYEKKEIQENKLTPKQEEKMVEFDEVVKKFEELKLSPIVHSNLKDNMEYILLAMLIYSKPKRADLGNVHIVYNTGEDIKENYKDKNYIILSKVDTDYTGTLVINCYKTAKVHGAIVEELCPTLVQIIKASLNKCPRDYLIVSASTNKPYEKNNSYSHFVKRTFDKHFAKATGISLWRSIYINANVDFAKMTYNELEERAKMIGHTVDTMMKTYRKV